MQRIIDQGGRLMDQVPPSREVDQHSERELERLEKRYAQLLLAVSATLVLVALLVVLVTVLFVLKETGALS
jgi:hypothetical protein